MKFNWLKYAALLLTGIILALGINGLFTSCQEVEKSKNASALRLHNIWIITSYQGQALKQEDFQDGLPQLEIYVADQHVLGYDGCNSFTGGIQIKEETITFKNFAVTEKACLKMKMGDQIVKSLAETSFEYQFKERYLVLSQDGTEIFRCIHID